MRKLAVWPLLVLLVSSSARAQAPDRLVPEKPLRVELTDDGQLTQGTTVLTPRDFFVLAGRDDLVAKSDLNLLRRRWLVATAAVVLVAAIVAGVFILTHVPDVQKPYCLSSVARYNECADYKNLYERGGIVLIGGGIFLSGLLATLGLWSRPGVLSTRDLEPLVTRYNESR
jgi:hypothetical protein